MRRMRHKELTVRVELRASQGKVTRVLAFRDFTFPESDAAYLDIVEKLGSKAKARKVAK